MATTIVVALYNILEQTIMPLYLVLLVLLPTINSTIIATDANITTFHSHTLSSSFFNSQLIIVEDKRNGKINL